MAAWWEGLTAFQQILIFIAVPGTILMLIMLIFMMFGAGEGFEGDIDIDGGLDVFNDEPLTAFSGLRIVTFRGVLVFLSIGGWVALIVSSNLNPLFSSLIGSVVGAIAAVLMAFAFRAMLKLESVGNLDYRNAIGHIGNVYIKVPKNKIGKGKVIITLQGRYAEMDAITEEEEDIKTGTPIEVVAIENESTVIVKRK